MKVEKARYFWKDNYPFLELIIDGKQAIISGTKKNLLDAGYVYLASSDINVDWEKILPPIKTPKDSPFGEIELTSFTDDPVIVQLARDFWDATNYLNGKKFEEGEIPIPTPEA